MNVTDGAMLTLPSGETYEMVGGSWQRLIDCTGVTASWCPIHGDCTCPGPFDPPPSLDNPGCALHSDRSHHSETGQATR